MPIVPDILTLINDLGGTMVDYEPVIDPTTDMPAAFGNALNCSVAMMSHTAPRALARVTTGANTGAMVLVSADAMWGNTVPPTPAFVSLGTFTLTYPATVNDEIVPPNAHTLNFRYAFANHRSAAAFFVVQAKVTSANVITFTVRDSTLALVNTAVDVDLVIY